MINHIVAASNQGNSTEGGLLLLAIIIVVVLTFSSKARGTIGKVSRVKIGKNPRSKIAQTLLGTRNRK